MAENNNPFLALFGNASEASVTSPRDATVAEVAFNDAAEKIFGLTLKPLSMKPGQPVLFYMRDLAEGNKQN